MPNSVLLARSRALIVSTFQSMAAIEPLEGFRSIVKATHGLLNFEGIKLRVGILASISRTAS